MANVRFFIRDKKAKKPQQIYLVYNLTSNEKIVYSTGLKIHPKQWNAKNYRVRDVANAQQKQIINNFLNELQTATENFILKTKIERKPITKQNIKFFLTDYFNNDTENMTFIKFIDLFIKERKTRINSKINKIVSQTTIQTYISTKKHLLNYSKETKNNINFNDIDLDFYYNFLDYLQNKNLALNTIGKYIRTIKTFLNEATARNYNTNLSFKSPHFRILTEETDSIYLTETELKRIFNLDLSKTPHLDKVRDFFLLGAYTGLRFSDLHQIKPENITPDNFLKIKTQKTGKTVVIPLHKYVLSILKKYQNKLPEIKSNQKFNKYIKEIGKKAEINEKTEKTQTKGKHRLTKNIAKYELITSHTARRSFATNMYKIKVPTITIMSITGHKTEKSFLKYIKVTPTEHAKILQTYFDNENEQTTKVFNIAN